jgi:hypothetical protein
MKHYRPFTPETVSLGGRIIREVRDWGVRITGRARTSQPSQMPRGPFGYQRGRVRAKAIAKVL